MKRFLAINEYILHSSELKAIDRIIIAKIDEFARAKAQCYMTNEAFAELTGESVSTVKRALDRLEEGGWIKRVTTTVTKDGKVAKKRAIQLGSHTNVSLDDISPSGNHSPTPYESPFAYEQLVIDNFVQSIGEVYIGDELTIEQIEAEKQCADAIKAIPYIVFLNTSYWKLVTESKKTQAGYKCAFCNGVGIIDTHHITYENHGYELRKEVFDNDLVAVCRMCHKKEHRKGRKYND